MTAVKLTTGRHEVPIDRYAVDRFAVDRAKAL